MAERCVLESTAGLLDSGLGERFSVIDAAGRERQAFAVRHAGTVYAYLNECAHIPIELDYQPGKLFDLSGHYLVCATHGAYYRPEDGMCVGGPCPGRRLTRLVVEERAGQLWLQGEEFR